MRDFVKNNGTEIINVTDSQYKSGTYGFWGNNCEVAGAMTLSNINILGVALTLILELNLPCSSAVLMKSVIPFSFIVIG